MCVVICTATCVVSAEASHASLASMHAVQMLLLVSTVRVVTAIWYCTVSSDSSESINNRRTLSGNWNRVIAC